MPLAKLAAVGGAGAWLAYLAYRVYRDAQRAGAESTSGNFAAGSRLVDMVARAYEV